MSNTQNQDYGSQLFADLFKKAIESAKFVGTSFVSNVFGNDTPIEFTIALINGDISKIVNSSDEASANLFSNYLKSLVAIRQTIRYENVIRYVAESTDIEATANKLNDKALDIFHGLAEKKHNLLTQIEFAKQNISSSILLEDKIKWQEVRDIALKELDKVNENIEIERKLFGVRISHLDTPEQILDKIVGENYGKTYFNELTKVFNYANFLRLTFDGTKLEETNAQAIFDYTASWINYTATVVEGKAVGFVSEKLDDVLHGKLFAGIAHLSTKTILATATRGVIVGVMTDISYKLGYIGGAWLWDTKFKEWHGVTASEYYADEFQTLYSTIFQHLTADKLNAVIAFNTFLLGNFVNPQGKSVIVEDTTILFGSKDYKEMDFEQALHIYKNLYRAITNSNNVDDIKTAEDMIRSMDKIFPIFKELRGKTMIIPQNFKDIKEYKEFAMKDDSQAMAYRFALKHLLPMVITDMDYSQYNSNGELELYSKDNPNGMTEEYIQARSEMLGFKLQYLAMDIDFDEKLQVLGILPLPVVQGDHIYHDLEHQLKLDIDRVNLLGNHYNIFGSKFHDKINGGSVSDKLFGWMMNINLKITMPYLKI